MYPANSSLFAKLQSLGMPQAWADLLRNMFGNPNVAIYHRAPVKIQLPSGSQIPTNARMQPNVNGQSVTTAINQPNQIADSYRIAPALTLSAGAWQALKIADGSTEINGSGMTVSAPTTHNGNVYHNAPVTYASNIRMMGLDAYNGGVYKYDQPGFGSTLCRVSIGAEQGSAGVTGSTGESNIATYSVQRIDENNEPVGFSFTAYDPAGFISRRRSCNASAANIGWVVYMSDRAVGGASADVAVDPNIGAWDIVSCGDDPQGTPIEFTFVAKVCCINNQLVVCTQTVSLCAPGNVGAIDCGGSNQCT